jgi:hypothetical protein
MRALTGQSRDCRAMNMAQATWADLGTQRRAKRHSEIYSFTSLDLAISKGGGGGSYVRCGVRGEECRGGMGTGSSSLMSLPCLRAVVSQASSPHTQVPAAARLRITMPVRLFYAFVDPVDYTDPVDYISKYYT